MKVWWSGELDMSVSIDERTVSVTTFFVGINII